MAEIESGLAALVARFDADAVPDGDVPARWRPLDKVNRGSTEREPAETRSFAATAGMLAALAWRSPTCSVEGCGRSTTEIDHRIPWAEAHRTTLNELDPLCSHHHRHKHHHGWALTDGTGTRPFVPPDDPRHPRRARTGDPPSAA